MNQLGPPLSRTSSPSSTAAAPSRPSSAPCAGSSSAATPSPCWPRTRWRVDVHATGATFRPWVDAPNRPSRRPEDDPYRDWECKNPLQLFARILDRQFVGPAPAYAADVTTAIAEDRPDLVVVLAVRPRGDGRRRGGGHPVRRAPARTPTCCPRPACRRSALGLRPATGPPGPDPRPADRRAHRPASGARACRRSTACAADLRPGTARVVLRPDPSRPPRAGADLAGLRLPGRAAGQRPLRRRRARRPDLGGGRAVGAAARRRTARARLAVVDLPGPRRLPPAHRRRASRPCRCAAWSPPARRSTRALIDRRRQRHRRAGRAALAGARPRAAVVVTHGGHGTVVRALAAGVPMVILPHGRDQADNAARVTRAGRRASAVRRSAKPRRIARAVERVLADPSYRPSAEQLGERSAGTPPAARWSPSWRRLRPRRPSRHRAACRPERHTSSRATTSAGREPVDGHWPDGPVEVTGEPDVGDRASAICRCAPGFARSARLITGWGRHVGSGISDGAATRLDE